MAKKKGKCEISSAHHIGSMLGSLAIGLLIGIILLFIVKDNSYEEPDFIISDVVFELTPSEVPKGSEGSPMEFTLKVTNNGDTIPMFKVRNNIQLYREDLASNLEFRAKDPFNGHYIWVEPDFLSGASKEKTLHLWTGGDQLFKKGQPFDVIVYIESIPPMVGQVLKLKVSP